MVRSKKFRKCLGSTENYYLSTIIKKNFVIKIKFLVFYVKKHLNNFKYVNSISFLLIFKYVMRPKKNFLFKKIFLRLKIYIEKETCNL